LFVITSFSPLNTDAPKPEVVNEQVRGALAGQKPQVDAEALGIKNALSKFTFSRISLHRNFILHYLQLAVASSVSRSSVLLLR